jgi:Fe-S-cluster-containing dehydrogenase component
MKKFHLIIDVEKCENCGNCFLACKDEHVGNDWPGYAAPQPNQGQGWITVFTRERGQYPLIDVAYLPVPCMHCNDAPCVKAAHGAIYKRLDGIVIIDPVKAKGQKGLLATCPYDVIRWNEDLGLPQKCTLCAHLLDIGWDKPRCVQSCPTGALTFQACDDYEMDKSVKEKNLDVFKPAVNTAPSVYYKNLSRYTRCFVGGSVATHVAGREECVEGVKVGLLNGAGEKVAETRTDAFGDFKFDDLARDSGKYTMVVTHKNQESAVSVDLVESVNAGTIYV